MDEKLQELLQNELAAQTALDWATDKQDIQQALDMISKSRQLTSAYILFKKKETEYGHICRSKAIN